MSNKTEKVDNLFQEVTSTADNVISKGKKLIRKYLIYVVLLFNIAIQVISKLYQIGLSNPFTVEFILELILSTIVTMICYVSFIPFGKADELSRNPSITENLALWGKLSETVRNGFNDLFRTFCFEQVAHERKEAREIILANNSLLTYNKYEECYMGKSKKEINVLVKCGELTRKEARAINRANGHGLFNPTKVKPINPIIILSGVKKQTLNDAGRRDSSYISRFLAKKPLLIFATTIALNAMTATFIGNENVILEMLISVVSIIVASICGYSVGQEDVREQNDKVKSRIFFISLFCEKNGIK
jgi:hypothetical protein